MDTPELYKLSDRIWWGNWAAFRRASVDARALISIAHAEQLHHRLKPFKVRTGAPYFWLPREDERPVCRAYMATLDTVADLINRERMYPAFVHCLAGHHRSPAVAAYLEWSAGERTLERAAAACQRVNDLLPTPGFHAFSRSLHDHIYDLAQHGHRTLPWPKKEPTAMLTATTYEQQYYDEHKAHGLDYLGHGTWQRDYGHWFVAALGLHNKRILDAGCACGSIALGLARAGASVVGADISRYMIALGKSTWPHLELHQADLADLFMLADESFDCVHSAQSAEHWPPERVPTILGELHRVLKPGGLFWCCLDTIELFARQGRLGDEAALKEDPTHICVRPMAWWDEQRDKAGFEDARGEVLPALADHPLSFFERYDWDWFCWRKP